MKKPFKKAAIPAALASTLTLSAFAEEAQPTNAGLEEVVVTAQKREQNLQDVPVAITAINAQAITDRNISDISDVGSTAPNVQIAPSPGGSTGATVAIRGAASINPAATWEPSVGIYMDGVFIAKNVGGIFDVAELSAIEILRGPQGTLYGKNTTGGAINLVTRKPYEEFGAKVKVGTGNYGYTEFAGTVDTGTVGDIASFMLSYSKRDRQGFYENTAPNAKIDKFKKLDSQAALFKANIDATDQLNFVYTVDYSKRDNTVALGQLENLKDGKLSKPKRLGKGALNGANFDKSESSGHSLITTYDIDDNLTVKSITAYREMKFNDYNDYDGTAAPIFETQRNVKHHQTSQEIQLIGTTNHINFVSGLFYYTDQVDAKNPYHWDLTSVGVPIPAYTLNNYYGSESTSYAVFGQADWLATDTLTLTLGGRLTQETKKAYVEHPDINPRFPTVLPYSSNAEKTWSNFSPMVSLSYAATDDLTTYAKVSQGWRAGGFNGESATKANAETPYDEETSTAYELGMKGQWFDNRLKTNLALFLSDIKNMQVSAYDNSTGYSKIENAGESQTRGIELETLVAITDELTAFFNYGYLHAEYTNFIDPLDGQQKKDEMLFAYAPDSKFSVGFNYAKPVGFAELKITGDYSYTAEQVFYRQKDAAAKTKSDAYGLLNGRIALADISVGGNQTLDLGLWGKNLTGEAYRVNGIPAGPTSGINYYGDPRTFGADVTYTF